MEEENQDFFESGTNWNEIERDRATFNCWKNTKEEYNGLTYKVYLKLELINSVYWSVEYTSIYVHGTTVGIWSSCILVSNCSPIPTGKFRSPTEITRNFHMLSRIFFKD